ncbi:hypothetical protein B0J13DRAFT_642202 [Dactylonectria estremocensis]|uniref:Uncharacterized protein n=1 Tax=Dactylonectria estremocensis TaxID=1079267 RepID=A0A9P9E5K0_9HYPO|nr:hypothetical protein B0J13DRAFT_642202 [Dactylonectria estremocensis]
MSYNQHIQWPATTVNSGSNMQSLATRALQMQQAHLVDQSNRAQQAWEVQQVQLINQRNQAREGFLLQHGWDSRRLGQIQRAREAQEAQEAQLVDQGNQAREPHRAHQACDTQRIQQARRLQQTPGTNGAEQAQTAQHGRMPIPSSHPRLGALSGRPRGTLAAARPRSQEQRLQAQRLLWSQQQNQSEHQQNQPKQQQSQPEQQEQNQTEFQQSQPELQQTQPQQQETQPQQQETQPKHQQIQPGQEQTQHEQQQNQCIYHLNKSKYRDPLKLPWDVYIQRFGFKAIWQAKLGSEQERYGAITAHLKAEDQGKSQAEADIVEQRAFWKCLPGRGSRMSPDSLSDKLKVIDDAALEVEKSWATKACNGLKHAKFTTDDKSGRRPYLYKQVEHYDNVTQAVSEILVTESLNFTRYYLGHREGDFIFRYCPAHPAAHGAFVDKDNGLAVGRDSFWFCGQVPRPQKHYLLRLQAVKCALIRAIASIIGFCAVNHSRLPCFITRSCKGATDMPREELVKLADFWSSQFPARKRMPFDTLGLMLGSPYVGEFAYLLEKQIDQESVLALKTELEPLVRILESGTRLKFNAIAKEYSTQLECRAYKQLFSGEHPANLLVFSDDYVNDIHRFYKQPHYHSDPYHPANRYKRVDIADALALSQRLRDPDWHRDNEHQAGDDESDSDSELSQAPTDDEEEDDEVGDDEEEIDEEGGDEEYDDADSDYEEIDPSYSSDI